MAATRIKTIVFDLGNVLVDVNYRNFTDAMGWDHETFMKFYNSSFFREFEIGKHTEKTFFKKLNEYIPLKNGDEQRYRDNIGKTFPLRPRTWAKVHWLRKHYQVILFSNTNSLDFDAVDKAIDLRRVIRSAYVSYAQGFIKPAPESYERVKELFMIDPANTLFVDDRIENVEGARKAGWHAEVVKSENELFKVFEKYQIN